MNNIDSVFSDLEKQIYEKATAKVEEESYKYLECLKYQISMLVSEMASGKSNLYDSGNATLEEQEFAKNPYSIIEIATRDIVQNGNAISKTISVTLKPGKKITSNISSAIFIANTNMKKIFGKETNNVVDR